MPRPPEADRAARRLAERRIRRAAARRRRFALLVVAAGAAVSGALVGRDSAGDEEPATLTADAPSCPTAVASDPRRLVGQMLIVRMQDTATRELRRAARRGEIGGVVVFPSPSTQPEALAAEIDALRSAAAAGDGPSPLVMIDQEGGDVKRLPELPPDRRPAAFGGAAEAFDQGAATGRALDRIGIDVDLAPVLDLPSSSDAFIAGRAFGTDAATVTELGGAFGEGLQDAGVAATAKHFPGLGLAPVNTDLAASTVDATRSQLGPGLEPFRTAVERQFALVMVSSATYPAYDRSQPASFSPRLVTGLLRGDLGFDGAVVSDDLGAGALRGAGIDEGEAAVRAARAGVDLLLFALSDGSAARSALVRALRRDQVDRDALTASCARTTALRERVAG